MRVLAYARVSGAEQGRHGTSLDGQRLELERWCAAHGHGAPALFVEIESASAERQERRVELRRLLDEARGGDIVLVCSADRWSRDLVWGVASVRELVRRGVGWQSIREGIDASTPQGDSTLGIMSWVADQERRRIRERTVGRRKALRDAGAYVEGLVPLGYLRGERPERRLRVDDDTAPIVREGFQRCIAGQSISEIAEWLCTVDPGGRRWDKSTTHRLLRSRVYLGELADSRGAWRPAHEAVIDRDTFARAQAAMRQRRRGGRPGESARTETWLLRGLAVCAVCGSRMGPAYSPGARAGRVEIHYYACAGRLARRGCTAPYARVVETDAAVAELVLERLQELRAELARPPAVPAREREDTAVALRRIEGRRQRVLDRLEDGTIPPGDARARLARLDEQRVELERQAAAAARLRDTAAPAARRAVLAEVRTLKRAWAGLVPAERREVVRLLAERVELGQDGPRVTWRTVHGLALDP